MKIEINLKILS